MLNLVTNIPPLTKMMIAIEIIVIIALNTEIVARSDLYFNFDKIVSEGEVYRLRCRFGD
jgi:hypothetical protein